MANKYSESDLGKKPPYIIFGFIGLMLTVLGVILLWRGYQFNTDNVKVNDKQTLGDIGQYGEYLVALSGSIFSLVGVFFLFLAFKQQGDSFRLERFESHFFEMMKIYRENVLEMEYEKRWKGLRNGRSIDTRENLKGRSVFIAVNDEFQVLYRFLRRYASQKHIYIKDPLDLIAITNLIVFFGLTVNGVQSIKHFLLLSNYDKKYVEIFNLITIELPKLRGGEYKTIFRGHQVRLGHYFRHLFQTVLFVHQKDFLTRQEKYDYIKILRGQMSTFEQAVFFYNSLSSFGSVWEHQYRDLDYNFKINPKTGQKYEVNGKEINEEDFLITEYRLIKNIPSGFTGDINPKDFYRKLPFEGEMK